MRDNKPAKKQYDKCMRLQGQYHFRPVNWPTTYAKISEERCMNGRNSHVGLAS